MGNETIFMGKAEGYAAHRPSYPKELLDFFETIFPKNIEIADIGAGTGIFSKALLEKDYSVTCVEPNEEMGAIAQKLLAVFPKFELINATAEETGILDHSINLITVAQAFHWFDASLFKKECQRILAEDGKVALIWNYRDESTALIKDYEKINKELCLSFKGFSEGINHEKITSFFKEDEYQILTFSNANQLTKEGFIGRALSSSYAPKATDYNYIKYQEAISELFDKYQIEGIINYPNITRLYLGNI